METQVLQTSCMWIQLLQIIPQNTVLMLTLLIEGSVDVLGGPHFSSAFSAEVGSLVSGSKLVCHILDRKMFNSQMLACSQSHKTLAGIHCLFLSPHKAINTLLTKL